MVRFGIEEEFMTLDPRTLVPVARGAAARAGLAQDRMLSSSATAPGGDVQSEYLDCQVEIATSPASTRSEACEQLVECRRRLQDFARAAELVVASSGTPYRVSEATSVTDTDRYHAVAGLLGGITREHFVNGLHVHTEVLGAEDQVLALNAVRPWLPVLLAATANAPFWRGRDSGFASWRSILLRRLPTMWCPPVFRDATDYQDRLDRLVSLGAAIDRASVAWAARVSDSYDTVEVRVFDAQLTATEALFAAVLTRAIIRDRPHTAELDSEAIDASLWMAAHDGVHGRVVDPVSGDVRPVATVLPVLMRTVSAALREHGDLDFVREHIERILTEGTGSDRQRRAVERGGAPALADLFADVDRDRSVPREDPPVKPQTVS